MHSSQWCILYNNYSQFTLLHNYFTTNRIFTTAIVMPLVLKYNGFMIIVRYSNLPTFHINFGVPILLYYYIMHSYSKNLCMELSILYCINNCPHGRLPKLFNMAYMQLVYIAPKKSDLYWSS